MKEEWTTFGKMMDLRLRLRQKIPLCKSSDNNMPIPFFKFSLKMQGFPHTKEEQGKHPPFYLVTNPQKDTSRHTTNFLKIHKNGVVFLHCSNLNKFSHTLQEIKPQNIVWNTFFDPRSHHQETLQYICEICKRTSSDKQWIQEEETKDQEFFFGHEQNEDIENMLSENDQIAQYFPFVERSLLFYLVKGQKSFKCPHCKIKVDLQNAKQVFFNNFVVITKNKAAMDAWEQQWTQIQKGKNNKQIQKIKSEVPPNRQQQGKFEQEFPPLQTIFL
jgi:hypothetical protein